MTAPFDPGGVERFRDLVARGLGLWFDDSKLGLLGDVLARRAEATGCPPGAYLARLDGGGLGGEAGLLAEELTVGETYFFRNGDQFRAFAEAVLPERMQARADTRQLRFLSAGCSSGDEAYTLAIILRETAPVPPWSVSIRAVDINPAALQKAASGRFTGWALRDTPPVVQERWFRPNGRDMVLLDEARSAVWFEERNLAVDDDDLWMADTYDAIFCRNVVMYFTPAMAEKLIGRITRSLVPGGYLFLGHAETLRGVSQDFHLVHTHETFYYRRKSGREGTQPHPAMGGAAAAIPARPFQGSAVADVGWVEAIGKATERIEALTRVGEALDLVHDLPMEAGEDADVLLLRAVLLADSGQVAAAGEACRRLLARDAMNAGANYVLALCFEAVGDRSAASDHYRVAAHLDAAFAMPWLHLGLLARRAGNLASARRELGQALALLQNEEASRLLLFGGGFTRDALLALCEAELRACEAAA